MENNEKSYSRVQTMALPYQPNLFLKTQWSVFSENGTLPYSVRKGI
ncbi:hypothetical protein QFZ78_006592 [Paenibacillus sp. V4I5]|nr:hypothetical protein [Paenibacillus sp. V4I5]